jgi:hypothetical protein
MFVLTAVRRPPRAMRPLCPACSPFARLHAMSANLGLFDGNSLFPTLLPPTKNSSNMAKCGSVGCLQPPFHDMQIFDVMKCTHFLAQLPRLTLNVAPHRAPRATLQRANSAQTRPENPSPAPNHHQPRANVIKSDVGKCGDAHRNPLGTVWPPSPISSISYML